MNIVHTCHAWDCERTCPPAMLMCYQCWQTVSAATQAEVYRTVGLRGKRTDRTWAPWWRAQAQACAEAAAAAGMHPDLIQSRLAATLRTATLLERK